MGTVHAVVVLTVLASGALFAAAWAVDHGGGDLRHEIRRLVTHALLPRGERRIAAAAAAATAELEHLLQQTTLDRVCRQLRDRSQLVHADTTHALTGPRLLVDLDGASIEIRLYRDAFPPPPAVRGGDMARMTSLAYVEGRGWQAVFDTPTGSRRYLGWHARASSVRGGQTSRR